MHVQSRFLIAGPLSRASDIKFYKLMNSDTTWPHFVGLKKYTVCNIIMVASIASRSDCKFPCWL